MDLIWESHRVSLHVYKKILRLSYRGPMPCKRKHYCCIAEPYRYDVGAPESSADSLQEAYGCRIIIYWVFVLNRVFVVWRTGVGKPCAFDVGIPWSPIASAQESYGSRTGTQWVSYGIKLSSDASLRLLVPPFPRSLLDCSLHVDLECT